MAKGKGGNAVKKDNSNKIARTEQNKKRRLAKEDKRVAECAAEREKRLAEGKKLTRCQRRTIARQQGRLERQLQKKVVQVKATRKKAA